MQFGKKLHGNRQVIARGRCKPNLLDIDRDELLTFFWLITMRGIKRLENYWSGSLNFCCELPQLKQFMSSHRFW